MIHPNEIAALGSIETLGGALDKYDIASFARDDPQRFLELVKHLSPRDQEIILCFAVLQKRPTDLSILFGKAGHRAEEDLHKAAHKLAGLAEFGPLPEIEKINRILHNRGIQRFHDHSFAACIRQYASSRDFGDIQRLVGSRDLRQEMLRAFKALHAAEGREEGLLAGWILWLVDGSDPRGKGWQKRKRHSRQQKLGPTVFHSIPDDRDKERRARRRLQATSWDRPASQKGGQGQRTANVKIQRRMKFVLRGMNA